MDINENKIVNEDELFTFIDHDSIESEKIIAPRYSYWRSVFRVFFRKKSNWVLLILFVLLFLGAFLIPVFCPYEVSENVTRSTAFHLSPAKAMQYFNDGKVLKWIFGTGDQGNSIFYGIWASARTSLLLAMICAAINMVVGIIVSHNADRLLAGGLLVILVVMAHNLLGLSIGFLLGKLLRLQKPKCVALSIEVGMQNSGLASSLAVLHFAAYPLATIPGAVFSVWHNISGALVAKLYQRT